MPSFRLTLNILPQPRSPRRRYSRVHERRGQRVPDHGNDYERAPKLVRSPLWPLVRPVLYLILGRHKAVRMADAIASMSGAESLDYVSNLLSLEVVSRHPDRLPAQGRCLVVCNHPTGIADGIAVYDAILKRRPDAIFFANADALRFNPRLAEALIPVEWVEAKRTREKTRVTLQGAKDAFESERCVVMFPAGRLARRNAEVALFQSVP